MSSGSYEANECCVIKHNIWCDSSKVMCLKESSGYLNH